MRKFNYLIRLIGLAMMAFIAYTSGAIPERICISTARKLCLLSVYESNVAAHRAFRVPKPEKRKFMSTWTDILGSEKMANDILNMLEKDWKYILDLADSDDNDITSLTIALHTKLSAYLQGWTYIMCLMYNQNPESLNKPENCRNLAAHLIIFSYLGTEKLIRKYLSLTRSNMAHDDWMGLLQFLFQVIRIPFYFREHLKISDQPMQEPQELVFSSEDDKTFGLLMDDMRLEVEDLKLLETLIMSIELGRVTMYDRLVEHVDYLWQLEYLRPAWFAAVNMNQRLTQRETEGSVKGGCNVMTVMSEIIVWRAQAVNVSRCGFVEEFEYMMTINPEIHISERGFSSNIKPKARE